MPGAHGDGGMSTPWPRVALNLDVLHIILAFLPRMDLLSASRTSRVVHELAVKELLSRHVMLMTPAELEAWCHFVLAGENRPGYVRDLLLYYEDLDAVGTGGDHAELFVAVLRRTTQLRKLSIECSDAILWQSSPEVSTIISRLPALESFEVCPFYPDSYRVVGNILANMKCRLQRVSLHIADVDTDDDDGNYRLYDLPRALAPHLEHLVKLELGSADGLDWPAIRSKTLRSLTIGHNGSEPRPRELFEAFPNLRKLRIDGDDLVRNQFDNIPEDLYPALRDSRLSEQAGGRTWTSLDTVKGCLNDLYVLAVACPVRRLCVYCNGKEDRTRELVRSATPHRLTLDFRSSRAERAGRGGSNLLVHGCSGRPQVTHLTVEVGPFQGTPVTHTPETIQNDLLLLLEQSNLEYLHARICSGYMVQDSSSEILADIDESAEQCVRALDVDLLRDALVGAATTLRVLAFTIATHGQMVWTIDRSGDAATTSRVEAVLAKELIRREEA
ncbi:hypothetical protein OH76DRAFT_1028917 [Lentinus brumalis]|uniref:F-box domain-containing protein n=1 Tax=Lentinus brumalis TaxID=2498619 RepID=A0A371CXB7_9APHY|nr:hypothetical protein OH76DRAFT_1028917 [Polyporus brumalis]